MSRERTTNPWIVLVLICMAQFMVILDATIVNVALPSIQKDLRLSEANLQWIVNAYTLVFGGFLLLGGRAGDLIAATTASTGLEAYARLDENEYPRVEVIDAQLA